METEAERRGPHMSARPVPETITRLGLIKRLRFACRRARTLEQDRILAVLLDMESAGEITPAQADAICRRVEERR